MLFEMQVEFPIPGFRPVKEEDRIRFAKQFAEMDSIGYIYSLSGPFCYYSKGNYSLYVSKTDPLISIVKKFKTTPKFQIFAPTEEAAERIIDVYNKLCEKYEDVVIVEATKKVTDKLIELDSTLVKTRTSSEFVYDLKLLEELKGGQFKSMRHRLSLFSRKYNWTTENLSIENHKDVIAMIREWMDTQGKKYFRVTVGRDIRLIEMYKDKVDNVNIFCTVLRVDGKVIGYEFIEKTNDEYVISVSAKTLPEYNESAYFLSGTMYKALSINGFKYVNVAGEYGKGTRESKEHWKPPFKIDMYSLKRK